MAFGLEEFNEGDVLFLGNWSEPAIAVIAIVAVGLLALTWYDLKELSRLRRWSLLSLRFFAMLLAVTMLLEPALELKNVTRVKNHVLTIVDMSESQTLPTSTGESRHERTLGFLDRIGALLTSPHEEHVFDLQTLEPSLAPITLEALEGGDLVPEGDTTHIVETLESIADRYSRQELGGIMLVSDGIDNGALGGRVHRGEELDSDTVALIERIGVPIHTLATADEGDLRDVAIERVLYDEFAFVRNAVGIEVEIRSLGFEDVLVPVTLSREGIPIQTRQVQLVPGQQDYRVEFQFVPELIGKEIYSVEIPVLEGEALAENNRQFFVIKIIRDKIRVLQVVGRPSYDERFLRQLLKGNPNIDLISFFILRTHEDLTRAPNSEMALIPFPTDELFNEELGSFDLVIFQNFTFEPYDMRQYLPNVREFVRNGGGFLMIGGDLAFSSGGYANTEIADILPVRLPPGGSARSLIDLRHFRPELTDAGLRHPITRLAFDVDQTLELWETLPAMPGTNIVLEPIDGATVLATHPELSFGGEAMPVITVANVEDGRSMAMTVDGSWRWNFEYVEQGGTSRPYSAFWNSAIRWLIRDPELNLIQVEIPEEIYEPGTEVPAVIRVFQPDYSPAVAAPGTVRVIRRDLDELAGGQGEVVYEAPFVTDDRGRFQMEFALEEAGAYRIEASAELEEGTPLRDDEIFLGISTSPELRDIEPRPDLLEQIADASGGRHFSLPNVRERQLEFVEAQVVEVNRRRIIDLWSNGWIMGLFALLLGADWLLRRRFGRL